MTLAPPIVFTWVAILNNVSEPYPQLQFQTFYNRLVIEYPLLVV